MKMTIAWEVGDIFQHNGRAYGVVGPDNKCLLIKGGQTSPYKTELMTEMPTDARHFAGKPPPAIALAVQAAQECFRAAKS